MKTNPVGIPAPKTLQVSLEKPKEKSNFQRNVLGLVGSLTLVGLTAYLGKSYFNGLVSKAWNIMHLNKSGKSSSESSSFLGPYTLMGGGVVTIALLLRSLTLKLCGSRAASLSSDEEFQVSTGSKDEAPVKKPATLVFEEGDEPFSLTKKVVRRDDPTSPTADGSPDLGSLGLSSEKGTGSPQRDSENSEVDGKDGIWDVIKAPDQEQVKDSILFINVEDPEGVVLNLIKGTNSAGESSQVGSDSDD